MDARPLLDRVARALATAKLDAVLIGNAAAALRGAPVTTLDFDFALRDTPLNRKKLKAFARALDAVVLRPYYPVSDLFRVVNDDIGLQVDFMPTIHGIRSYESLRRHSEELDLDGKRLRVASLEDVVRSKRAANRAKDRAVLSILERTLREAKK